MTVDVESSSLRRMLHAIRASLLRCGRHQNPCSEAEALPIVRTHQDDVCGLDEQGSEILASPLGDAAQDGSTACAVLTWHETKPRAKIAPELKCLTCTNGSDPGGRNQRANAGSS